MDRSTSVNNESAANNSPKGMFDKLKNIFGRKIEGLQNLRESRLLQTNNQNRFTGQASESGANLTSEKNTDARDDIARASQDIELLKSRSEQPNS